ncbi:MAG: hypothetical protein M3N29_07215 [Chloroflexota bacterium]|nr:hypothetical protein [Chloroflexota bacterium]
MTDDSRRSKERCPVCGKLRLALVPSERPDLRVVRPYDELIGMGDPSAPFDPAITCLACGSEWSNLAEFRAAQRRGPL